MNTTYWFSTILSFALFIIMASATSPFAGEWTLAATYNTDSTLRELPTPKGGGTFTVKLEEASPTTFKLYTKIGNNMASVITLLGESTGEAREQSIKVSPPRSTMMMPGPELYELEKFLTAQLPALTTMEVSADGNELVLSGDGKIVLRH